MEERRRTGGKLMLVDQSKGTRELLEFVFRDSGFNLLFPASENSAMAEIQTHRPDLVILNFDVPNGASLCRALRRTPEVGTIMILAGASNHDRDTRLEALRAGADDVLDKPFDPHELWLRVTNCMRLGRFRRIEEERDAAMEAVEAVKMAYDQTIAGLAQALELRDSETHGHSERVARWTVQLCRLAGIDESRIEAIHRGALLHDIGKIGVSDAVLRKPGNLTPTERREIEAHPELAYHILGVIDYLQDSLAIPYYHHERWDGTGYPCGLSDEMIPLEARIFTVVDVFDALTSNRPYRTAMAKKDVLQYLEERSGTEFDPQVVALFLEHADRFEPSALPVAA